MGDELRSEIWANAVLKDGKLIFWWTGDKCKENRKLRNLKMIRTFIDNMNCMSHL